MRTNKLPSTILTIQKLTLMPFQIITNEKRQMRTTQGRRHPTTTHRHHILMPNTFNRQQPIIALQNLLIQRHPISKRTTHSINRIQGHSPLRLRSASISSIIRSSSSSISRSNLAYSGQVKHLSMNSNFKTLRYEHKTSFQRTQHKSFSSTIKNPPNKNQKRARTSEVSESSNKIHASYSRPKTPTNTYTY